MDDFYSDQQNRPKESPLFDLRGETPEEIVAQNVSQQLLNNALESQKHNESQDMGTDYNNPPNIEHSFGEPLVEEPFHQNIDIQSEHRFSGFPTQQYIYDEEEEDEEEEDEEDIHPIERYRKGDDLLQLSGSPHIRAEDTGNADNLFDLSIGTQNKTNEILYQLSDDNVLTAQSYGIGSDLRIGSTTLEPNITQVSTYELNSEDPFSTPQKQRPESNKRTEEEFERFVDKCEPFETITTDLDKPMSRQSINLLNLDQSITQTTNDILSQVIPPESHSIVESRPESQTDSHSNHALKDVVNSVESDKSSEVLPSSVVDTELSVSQMQSTNRSDTHFNPTLSPNLDSLEPTLTSTTHHFEEAFPSAQPNTSSPQLIETSEESPITSLSEIQTTKAAEPQEEPISRKMPKRGSEHAVTTSTDSTNEGNCPFSPSAWFNPNQLNPTVAEFVYWRDPKKSGVVFGSGLAILLSLTVFSIISVVAYTSLAVLSVTLSFRIYKNILQAVQKTSEGHPFKEYLEIEITPSSERIHEIVDSFLSHTNCTLNKLRSVFLVEDIIDSLKFVVLFWCLTYIGSWFNGLTLIILAYLALFSLPKVYELNKTQIDQYLSLASTQINEITSKIRAKIPFPAKKDKEN